METRGAERATKSFSNCEKRNKLNLAEIAEQIEMLFQKEEPGKEDEARLRNMKIYFDLTESYYSQVMEAIKKVAREMHINSGLTNCASCGCPMDYLLKLIFYYATQADKDFLQEISLWEEMQTRFADLNKKVFVKIENLRREPYIKFI